MFVCTLETGVSRLGEPPEGPKGFHQDARRPVRKFAEVTLRYAYNAGSAGFVEGTRLGTRRVSGCFSVFSAILFFFDASPGSEIPMNVPIASVTNNKLLPEVCLIVFEFLCVYYIPMNVPITSVVNI